MAVTNFISQKKSQISNSQCRNIFLRANCNPDLVYPLSFLPKKERHMRPGKFGQLLSKKVLAEKHAAEGLTFISNCHILRCLAAMDDLILTVRRGVGTKMRRKRRHPFSHASLLAIDLVFGESYQFRSRKKDTKFLLIHHYFYSFHFLMHLLFPPPLALMQSPTCAKFS